MKRNYVKRLANVVCALALMVAPIASNYCRMLFYQPQEPDGLSNLALRAEKKERK